MLGLSAQVTIDTEVTISPEMIATAEKIIWQQSGVISVSHSLGPDAAHHRFHLELDLTSTSIRAILASLSTAHIACHRSRVDNQLETRKQEMMERREAELAKWRNAFWQSMMFTVPVSFIAMVCPWIPCKFVAQR